MEYKKIYFNPGCALSLYKPEMEERILAFLNQHWHKTEMHKICCRHEPGLEKGSLIINVCAGCDRRFSSLYEGISTLSLWEVLGELDAFPFPDHTGLTVSIHDPCPIRGKPRVHAAVRSLLEKMNVHVIETRLHSSRSVCCGDSFYPLIPMEKIHRQMKKRTDSMPCKEVVVSCVSCIKAMSVGGKTPLHLVDLLFNERTEPQITDIAQWHELLQEYIDEH